MASNNFNLTGKWFFINCSKTVTLVATNNDEIVLQAGFYAFSRDELQEYFTNNYVTVEYSESDSVFRAFCLDFVINGISLLPAPDATTDLSTIESDLDSIKSGLSSLSTLVATSSGQTELQGVVAKDSSLQSIITALAVLDTLGKDTTLQSILTALGSVGKDSSLQSILTAFGALATESTLSSIASSLSSIATNIASVKTSVDSMAERISTMY